VEPVTIGEVERLTGVSAKTLRYYHQIGLLEPAASTAAGYRRYGEAELWRLNLIRSLREMDFSLRDIGALLAGERAADAAVTLQLEAVEVELARLERVRSVLRRVQRSEGGGLGRLEALAATLRAGERERQRFLAAALRDAIAAEAPPAWRRPLLDSLARDLPDDTLDGDRLEAAIELLELLRDDELRATLTRQVRPFWETARQHEVEPRPWMEGMGGVLSAAVAAHRAGAGPASDEVQAAVTRCVDLFAAAQGREADAAFVAEFAPMAERMLPEEGVRIQRLLARIRGEGGEAIEAQRLLLEGVRWRVRNA
jgi:DNA-binding transcriptional MerR regulator